MMPLVGAFVAGRLAGNFDGDDVAFGGERFERTVNSGKADAGDFLESKLVDFHGGERIQMLGEHRFDGVLLFRTSFHGMKVREKEGGINGLLWGCRKGREREKLM
jgi:hypothetical protein